MTQLAERASIEAVQEREVVMTPGALRQGVVVAAVVASLAGSTTAKANLGYTGRPDCEPNTPERPYVCDVGEPKPVSLRSFSGIIAHNDAIRSTVQRLGMPDWVEYQRVHVEAPWQDYEIRVYYRDFNRMFSFGRAFLLDLPQVALLRYQGPIPPGKFAHVAQPRPYGDADAEAGRAERAAAEAEARAERAERDAARADATAEAAAREFKRGLLKN